MLPRPPLIMALLLGALTIAGSADAGPKKPKPPKDPKPTSEEAAPFDKQAAATSLAAVDLGKCKSTNAPKGDGHVRVTFLPKGTATEAVVDKGTLAKTPVAKCIAQEFKKATIPPFSGGGSVQVGKSFRFE